MYICKDVWLIIKDFLFHDIKKHGMHLKSQPEIKIYNKTLQQLPRIYPPHNGPRIYKTYLYCNSKLTIPIAKFVYHLNPFYHRLTSMLTIIEIFKLPADDNFDLIDYYCNSS